MVPAKVRMGWAGEGGDRDKVVPAMTTAVAEGSSDRVVPEIVIWPPGVKV